MFEMWQTLSVRYTVVALLAASSSRAVPGLMKCVTSAMCTPTLQEQGRH